MDFAESGPVDIFMLRFPGNEFRSGIARALRELAVSGPVRVIDLLFVFKTAQGEVGWIDLDSLRAKVDPHFSGLEGHLGGGLLDLEDVDEVASSLDDDSSLVVVVVENSWAIPFIATVRRAGGVIFDRARMPTTLLVPYAGTAPSLPGEQ